MVVTVLILVVVFISTVYLSSKAEWAMIASGEIDDQGTWHEADFQRFVIMKSGMFMVAFYPYVDSLMEYLTTVSFALLYMAAWMWTFNVLLNIRRGRPWFYIGKTADYDLFLREISADITLFHRDNPSGWWRFLSFLENPHRLNLVLHVSGIALLAAVSCWLWLAQN